MPALKVIAVFAALTFLMGWGVILLCRMIGGGPRRQRERVQKLPGGLWGQ